MASRTPKLGLIKPAGTDNVQVSQFNENSNIIDSQLGQAVLDIEALKTQKIPQSIIDQAIEDYLDEHGLELRALTISEINQAFSEVEV